MNPLLLQTARRVKLVLTLPKVEREGVVVRPETPLYVRAITGAEFAALVDLRIKNREDQAQFMGSELEAYVCDEAGHALLGKGEGSKFCEVIESSDVRRLIDAGDKLNALNDDAVEDELKN